MTKQKLTRPIIEAAILGFESQREKLAQQVTELRAMLDGGPKESAATPEPAKRKRRKMSAAGRKAIADAQRKRWAASKKAAEPTASQKAPKAKRKLSAAGRAAIVAATKARWDRVRAEAAKKKPAAKKAAVKKAAVKTAPAVSKKAAVRKSAAKKSPAKTGGKGPQKKAAAVAQEA
jgi:hypothetical protein